MTDFSQFGEQAHILKAVGSKADGRFLDIGAFHPECFSNTRALWELGWSGVMVEPSPKCMLNLMDAYGNDIRITLIQAAVAVEPGLLSLHITDDAVSTSSEAEYSKWKDATTFRGKLLVPVITLEELAIRYGGPDMISLDAEGQSADLFLQMMAMGWGPKCIVVEHDSRSVELMAKASDCHYVCVHANSTNLVFVRSGE